MKKALLILASVAIFTTISCKKEDRNLPEGLYAEMETAKGTILLKLYYKETPITVANFITLAEGKNQFVNEEYKGKKLFDGLKFHRVLENFMIQGGDPLGNGSGDTGYKFKDEITKATFDKEGLLAMANSGPNTNSSQFFITHVKTPWLDGKHTIFGEVVQKGMEVVNAIKQDDAINKVTILRIGEDAKKFNSVKVFDDYFSKSAKKDSETSKLEIEKVAQNIREKLALFATKKAEATKSPTGLLYYIDGEGVAAKNGQEVNVNYAGYLESGTLFDTSDAELAKSMGKYDEQRAQQSGYRTIPYTIGSKGQMIAGFEEGLSKLKIGQKAILFIPSNLAYGVNGAGNIIPPNSNIIFEVTMTNK
jgi:peptidylprolyl isomerase